MKRVLIKLVAVLCTTLVMSGLWFGVISYMHSEKALHDYIEREKLQRIFQEIEESEVDKAKLRTALARPPKFVPICYGQLWVVILIVSLYGGCLALVKRFVEPKPNRGPKGKRTDGEEPAQPTDTADSQARG